MVEKIKYTFRFDDVCVNSDLRLLQNITDFLFEKFDCEVIYGISPLVHKSEDQRVFPKILNAYSDYKGYYCVDALGVPEIDKRVKAAGHGLVHVDHRLLSYGAQELSILTSCSLVDAEIFIPPFNKWNKDTEEICKDSGIWLIKFEDGWKSMEYNEFVEQHNLWYLHAREWTLDKIKIWFQ